MFISIPLAFLLMPGSFILSLGCPLLIMKLDLPLILFLVSVFISILIVSSIRRIFEIFSKFLDFIKSVCRRFDGDSFNLGDTTIYIRKKRDNANKQWNHAKAIIMGTSVSRNMIEYVFSANHTTFVGYAPLFDYPDIKINQEIDISYHPRNPQRNAVIDKP